MNDKQLVVKDELIDILRNSLYPGASSESIGMVIGYCKSAGLDPMQKPVHIVPMYDNKIKAMRDVIMPGINMYRIAASRTGECAGISEPEFGPMRQENLGGMSITFPEWCRITVKRQLKSGYIAEFTATEFWLENYAIKGGFDKSKSPNSMWEKRTLGQLAKCTEAQAWRKAFPEIMPPLSAEEMQGKSIDDAIDIAPGEIYAPKLRKLSRDDKINLVGLGEAEKQIVQRVRLECEDENNIDYERLHDLFVGLADEEQRQIWHYFSGKNKVHIQNACSGDPDIALGGIRP